MGLCFLFLFYVGDMVIAEALDHSIAMDLIVAFHFHLSEGDRWQNMIGHQFFFIIVTNLDHLIKEF